MFFPLFQHFHHVIKIVKKIISVFILTEYSYEAPTASKSCDLFSVSFDLLLSFSCVFKTNDYDINGNLLGNIVLASLQKKSTSSTFLFYSRVFLLCTFMRAIWCPRKINTHYGTQSSSSRLKVFYDQKRRRCCCVCYLCMQCLKIIIELFVWNGK